MKRKEKKRNEEIEKINRILKTLPNGHPDYVLKKKCPRCLSLNDKDCYFCTVCNFAIQMVKVIKIYKKV